MEKYQRLIEFRKWTGKSQEFFASALEMSRHAYMPYEKNERKFSGEFLLKLYDVYGLNPTWLLTGTGTILAEKAIITASLKMKLEDKNYAWSIQPDMQHEQLFAAIKSHNKPEKTLLQNMIKEALDKCFHHQRFSNKNISFSHVINELFSNRTSFFFLKVLENRSEIKEDEAYKTYLARLVTECNIEDIKHKFNCFNFRYNEKDQIELLRGITQLKEVECIILMNNIELTKQLIMDNIDMTTHYVDKWIA